jgi:hypothetical protein
VPCNTIQRSRVEFLAASTDTTLLAEALRKLGCSSITLAGPRVTFNTPYGGGSFDKTSGEMRLPESLDINVIKQAYSVEVVESQAKKYGWKIAWTTNTQGHREAAVQRRG